MRKEIIGSCELYLGDCREVLPGLGRVDAVVTDPPYSSGGFQESGKSAGSLGTRGLERIAADNLSTRGYVKLLSFVCSKTRADEYFCFTDWRMWTSTFDCFEVGFIRVRNMIVWDKKQMGMGLPWRNQHELIAYGKRTSAKNITGNNGNVIQFARQANEDHPTQKPVGLIEILLNNSSARTVLDPFMGSGTTGVACANLGRGFIGIEVDPQHYGTALRRIEAAYRQPRLFAEPAPKPTQETML